MDNATEKVKKKHVHNLQSNTHPHVHRQSNQERQRSNAGARSFARSYSRSYAPLKRQWKKKGLESQSLKKRYTTRCEEVPGLFQITMSSSLQSLLSCRIGIDITNDKRWIYVDKQLILDEMQKNKNNTVFDSMELDIITYPEDNILIGSYGNSEFFICLSEYSKDVCENWMKEEQKILEEELLRFICLQSRPWITLGSEEEIYENIAECISHRPLFDINIILQYPLVNKTRFELRLVENAKDGYVELVTNRVTYEIIHRKRIDKSIQAATLKLTKASQTLGPASMHRNTEYKFTYKEIAQTKDLIKKLNIFLTLHNKYLSNIISSNSFYNLFKNDYKDLPNQKTRHSIEDPTLLLSLHDCIECHLKMVNCLSYNSYMSGIIAVAYARTNPKYLINSPNINRDSEFKVFDNHLVLIWSLTDSVKPVLYLHSTRELTAISFCPYDRNIIIGGSCDGRIFVWDITGRSLTNKESKTLRQQHLNAIIETHMYWMKNPPGEKHVFPCILSKIEYCHKSHVTAMQWIPSNYQMTKRGAFVECEENEEHMQFITTSLTDGCLLVWDLKPKYSLESKKKQRRFVRSARPAALDESKSPLVELNQNFIPIFQLILTDAETRYPIHVNFVNFKMGGYCYIPTNPETSNNQLQTTWYVRDQTQEIFQMEQTFIVCTEFGKLYRCTWDAHAYDQGLLINKQMVDTMKFVNYHDGPVDFMQRNYYYPNLILTAGGRVFAVWDSTSSSKVPLLWRKGSLRYVKAIWSLETPGAIVVAREDAKIELWDIVENSKQPLRLTKFKGNELMSVFIDMNNQHVLKRTCLTTTFNASLSLYTTPSNLFASGFNDPKKNVESILERREQILYWKDYVIRKQNQFNENHEISNEEPPIFKTVQPDNLNRRSTEKSIKICPVNNWQTKQFARMYNVLIANKNLNLKEIEKQRKPMEILMGTNESRLKKIELIISNKAKIYEKHKAKVCNQSDIRERMKIKVGFPKELVKILKNQYYEEYLNAEINASNYINTHRYRFFFDWELMIQSAKHRFRKGQFDDGRAKRYSANENLFNILPKEFGRASTKIILTELPRMSRHLSLP